MHTIYIAGLGPGEWNQMPVGVLEALKKFTGPLYVRTFDHPVIEELAASGVHFESFDKVYEIFNEDFDQVYPAIAAQLMEKSQEGDLLYAVPGHPMVAEKTVQLLLEDPHARVEVIGGQSFIDDMFLAVQEDPVEGFQLLDASDFTWTSIAADQHVIFMQVFHPFIASQLKLELARIYPSDHEVALVDKAGTAEEQVVWKKLQEMDDFEGVHNLLSVYVPPLTHADFQNTLPSLQAYISEQIEVGKNLEDLTFSAHFADLNLENEEILAEILGRALVTLKNGEELGYFKQQDIIKKIREKIGEGWNET